MLNILRGYMKNKRGCYSISNKKDLKKDLNIPVITRELIHYTHSTQLGEKSCGRQESNLLSD